MPFFGPRSHNPPPLPTSNFTISADTTNWNLIAQLGYTPTFPISVTITVNSGRVVRSTSPTVPAMNLTGLFAGSTIALINNGTIHGRGGTAGAGDSGAGPTAGSQGGNAIETDGNSTLTITNGAGYIFAGGGGGGGGGRANDTVETSSGEFTPVRAGGGGGGAGAGQGTAGAGGTSTGPGATNGSPGGTGTTGTAGAPGTGGSPGTVPGACGGGTGGTGGAYGAAGTAGAAGVNGTSNTAGAAGGSAGRAVRLNGGPAPTWVSGNTADRVKGTVGG